MSTLVIGAGEKLAKAPHPYAKIAGLILVGLGLWMSSDSADDANEDAEKNLSGAQAGGEVCSTCEDPDEDPEEKPDHQAGKSTKRYGHARSEHGSQRSAQSLQDRARGTGANQGHFSDNRMIEEAFSKAPKETGVYDVVVSKASNVYTPAGQTLRTNTVRVVIGSGGPRTAYPFIP